MAAACRFVINILMYAALDLNHWLPVAFTTAGTSIFAVAKVFEYQWTKFGMLTFDVFLVISSFVVSWAELWFLDFRVLPLETRAAELENHHPGGMNDPRAPLLRHPGFGGGVVSGGHGSMLHRYVADAASSLWDGSVANFYSPLETPEDSGDELEEGTLVTVPRKFKRKMPLNQKVERKLYDHSM